MADISKIRVGGTLYDVKDATARAAQATTAGEVSDLKSAVNTITADGDPLIVRNGAINTSTGNWGYNNNKRAIYDGYLGVQQGHALVKINDGYTAVLFAYEQDGTFIGSLKTDGRFTSIGSNFRWFSEYDFRYHPDYKFNIMLKNTSDTNFTPSDYGNLIVRYITDKTLEHENSPADAKATGDAIAAEHDYIDVNVNRLGSELSYNPGTVISFQDGIDGAYFESDNTNQYLYIKITGSWYLRGNAKKDLAYASIVTDNRYTTPSGVSDCIRLSSNQGLVYDRQLQTCKIANLADGTNQSADNVVIFKAGLFDRPKYIGVVGGIGQWIYLQYRSWNYTDTTVANTFTAEKKSALQGELIALSEFNSSGTPSKRCYTIATITDTHGSEVGWADMVSMLKSQASFIDAACFLGDLVQDPTTVPSFYDLTDIQKPFAFCIGNHDIGGGPQEAGISPSTAFTRYISPMVAMGHIATDKNYYYFDNATYKIRTIVLYEFEASQDTDSCETYYYRRYISSTQLQWFADTLYSTPEDYSVVVLTHQVVWTDPTIDDNLFSVTPYLRKITNGFRSGDGYILNNMSGNAIGDVVNAFIHSLTVNKTYTNNAYTTTGLPNSIVSKDFTGRANGKFICYLSGHSHAPYILHGGDYSDQLQILVPSASTNIYQRRADDIRPELAQPNYYVISFDTANKKVKLLKIGRRTTIDMRLRVCGIIPY